MTRLRIHSDCGYFAGCENMLANFFAEGAFARDLDVTFSYRPSPAYDEGFRARVPHPPRLRPLPVVDFVQVSGVANCWPAPLRGAYKSLLRLVLAKYWLALWNVWVLWRSLGETPAEIVHINNGGFPGALSCLAAAIAARLRGVHTVVHVVNNLPVPYRSLDRWLDWPLDRLAIASATRFVTGSEQARRNLAAVLNIEDARTLSLPNGIMERAITETAAEVRDRVKAPAGRPLVAVVAVLEPRKGHRVLLEALARLKKEGLTPFPFTALAGDGPLRSELEALAQDLGLTRDVAFLGWESRHFDLFNASDAVVLPSTGFEDFPNVIIEAMGLGKSVVATRVGGVEEQFVDGESGLLVRPGDPADLARALGAVLRDTALRGRLGRGATARFQERFTAEASVARYRTLYRSLHPGA